MVVGGDGNADGLVLNVGAGNYSFVVVDWDVAAYEEGVFSCIEGATQDGYVEMKLWKWFVGVFVYRSYFKAAKCFVFLFQREGKTYNFCGIGNDFGL